MSSIDISRDIKQDSRLGIGLGLITLLAGVAALVWPGLTLVGLAVAFGVAVLCIATTSLVVGIAGTEPTGRGVDAVLGVFGIVAGVVALSQPGRTLLFLIIASGTWLVVAGAIDFVSGLAADVPGRGWRIVTGAVDVATGVLVVAWPGLGLATLALLIGVALTVRGAVLIGTGISVHRAVHELGRDVRSTELHHAAR